MGAVLRIIVLTLFAMSIGLFVAGTFSFVKQLCKNRSRSLNQKLYAPTLYVFLSIFMLRYSTAFNGTISRAGAATGEGLSWAEGALDSFVHTLQTFSLDADYTETIAIGKDLFANEFGSNFLSSFYGLFSALLNVCAPVMGGALLLGILASAFPRIGLRLRPLREKYVFSELNDRAINLAEDIIREAKKGRGTMLPKLPLIVFTDSYVDNDSEVSSELHQRAKEIGAICIKDDLLKLRFPKTRKLRYILLDDEEIDNIHTLTTLATERPAHWNERCGVHIYVFSQNNEIGSIVKRIYGKEGRRLSNVVIKVVQEYTSIAYNLLNDVPLYYPLLSKYPPGFSGRKDLTVTIVGGGLIGTEVFLGAYWCGQILDCRLKINVVTEDAGKFRAKIEHINPELLQSGTVDGSANPALLRTFPGQGACAEAYAGFGFYGVDVERGDFADILDKKDADGAPLFLSDYFVVALGSDALNMAIAAEINRKVQRESLSGPIKSRPVIAYSIYNSNTKDVLNTLDTQNAGAFLYAFAALKDIYSCKNIFMKHVNDAAFSFNRVHNQADLDSFLKDEYGWWSSIARALHRKYKIYSAGLLGRDGGARAAVTDEEEKEYRGMTAGGNGADRAMCERLTWLEHRRWNAFMRTKGFTAPTGAQWERYAYKNGLAHKHIDLKLHPCIVECLGAMHIEDEDWDDPSYMDNRRLDCLDIVSIMVYRKQIEGGLTPDRATSDYKFWDHPRHDEE